MLGVPYRDQFSVFRNITQFSRGTNQAVLGFLLRSKFSLFSPCSPFS